MTNHGIIDNLIRRGYVLNAIVIDKGDGVVLAIASEGPLSYITWMFDHLGNTFSGHYFTTLEKARSDFKLRISAFGW